MSRERRSPARPCQAVLIGRGYDAGDWRLETAPGAWETDSSYGALLLVPNDDAPGYRGWVMERDERGAFVRVVTSHATDRTSAAMLALVGYVRVLRERAT